jgi:hypothetical protein
MLEFDVSSGLRSGAQAWQMPVSPALASNLFKPGTCRTTNHFARN